MTIPEMPDSLWWTKEHLFAFVLSSFPRKLACAVNVCCILFDIDFHDKKVSRSLRSSDPWNQNLHHRRPFQWNMQNVLEWIRKVEKLLQLGLSGTKVYLWLKISFSTLLRFYFKSHGCYSYMMSSIFFILTPLLPSSSCFFVLRFQCYCHKILYPMDNPSYIWDLP